LICDARASVSLQVARAATGNLPIRPLRFQPSLLDRMAMMPRHT
jgi:hypothetical protein